MGRFFNGVTQAISLNWAPSGESVCDFLRGCSPIDPSVCSDVASVSNVLVQAAASDAQRIRHQVVARAGDVTSVGYVVGLASINVGRLSVLEIATQSRNVNSLIVRPAVIGAGHVALTTSNIVIGLTITALPSLVGSSNWVFLASVQANIRNSLRLRVADSSRITSYHTLLRRRFRHLPFAPLTNKTSNPHGFHAGVRTQARCFATSLARAMQFEEYQVPDPDEMLCVKEVPIPDRPLIVMIDVDFKLTAWQLQRLLARGPVLMFTYLLDRLSHESAQGGFTFHSGLLTCLYDGASYKEHPVWDWNSDQMLIAEDGLPSILAMVDHRPMSDMCRAMVLLTPKAFYPSSSYFLVNTLYDFHSIQRFASNVVVCPKTGNVVEYAFIMGKVALLFNGKTSFNLKADVYHDLCSASRTTASFSVHTVGRLSQSTNVYLLKEALAVIAPFDGKMVPPTRARDYRPIFADLPEDEVLRGNQITKAIVDRGIIPTFGPSADEACVQGRVEDIRPKENKIPADMQKYSNEFRAKLFSVICPDGLKLEPYTAEDILDNCDAQEKAKYVAAAEGDPLEEVIRRTFQKVEAYPEVKAPRDIKDVPKPLVMEYSRFVKAVVDALKQHTYFYAFGLPPEELVKRVVRVCEGREYICTTDFSKFDGTQGRWIFNEFIKDMIQFFPACYHARLRALLNAHSNLLHVTKFGRFFLILFQMLSGGADTTLRNTLNSARGCFIVLRRSGLDYEAAWEAMGLLGGDDGLAYYPDIDIAIETYGIIGFKIKLQKKNAEDQIDFLGRIYPDPFGSLSSHHDISRAAGKLHISPHELDNVSREVMAWRKAVSLWVTDSQTPVLNVWARTVLRLVPQGTWQASWQTKAHGAWPLEHGKRYLSDRIQSDWLVPIFPPPNKAQQHNALANFLDCEGISMNEFRSWESMMDAAMTFEQFPEPLRIIDHVSLVGLPCVVDGQLSGTPAVDTSTIVCFAHINDKEGCSKKNCPDHHPKYFCHAFARGKCERKDPPCTFAHIDKNTRVPVKDVLRPPKPRARKKKEQPTTTPPVPVAPTTKPKTKPSAKKVSAKKTNKPAAAKKTKKQNVEDKGKGRESPSLNKPSDRKNWRK